MCRCLPFVPLLLHASLCHWLGDGPPSVLLLSGTEAVEGAKPEREYRILHERQKLAHQVGMERDSVTVFDCWLA